MPRRRASFFRLTTYLLVVSAGLGCLLPAMRAQVTAPLVSLELEPAQSKINWTLSATFHTVHGTFACTKGAIQFDPATGKAGGEIVADARSGESGDPGRDKNMHQKVLESEKYQEVRFLPDRVDGKVALQGTSKVQVHGTFEIHGAKHELTVPAEVNFSAERWTAKAAFDVPYVQWGMKDPSNIFLHVGPAVNVELELAGRALLPRTN